MEPPLISPVRVLTGARVNDAQIGRDGLAQFPANEVQTVAHHVHDTQLHRGLREYRRDRDGSFEPQLIGKRQTPWPSFDDKILSLYA
jgi:transposase-like protein